MDSTTNYDATVWVTLLALANGVIVITTFPSTLLLLFCYFCTFRRQENDHVGSLISRFTACTSACGVGMILISIIIAILLLCNYIIILPCLMTPGTVVCEAGSGIFFSSTTILLCMVCLIFPRTMCRYYRYRRNSRIRQRHQSDYVEVPYVPRSSSISFLTERTHIQAISPNSFTGVIECCDSEDSNSNNEGSRDNLLKYEFGQEKNSPREKFDPVTGPHLVAHKLDIKEFEHKDIVAQLYVPSSSNQLSHDPVRTDWDYNNLGEPYKPLTVQHLMPYVNDLADEVVLISGWLGMGEELEVIRRMFGMITPGEQLQKLLKKWLEDTEHPTAPHTWEYFVKVVREVRKGHVAEKIVKDVFQDSGLPSDPVALEKHVVSKMADNWYQFGIHLGLPDNTLKAIAETKLLIKNSARCLVMFQRWMEEIGPVENKIDKIEQAMKEVVKVTGDKKSGMTSICGSEQEGEASSISNDAIPAWVGKMAENWFNFGVALGFSEEDLQSIKDSNDDDVARCSAMLYRWLRTGDQREKTHERLLRAAKEATPPVATSGRYTELPTYLDLLERLCVHKGIKANCFVLGDVHTLPITHQGGTFPLHPFGPCGGEQQVECCATLEAPPGVVGSGVTVSVHYAIILDGPFKFPEEWERTSVVLYIDCPEKRLLKKPLHINLRHWAVCQPDVLAVMKADHDYTGRQREGIMFKQFSASAASSPNAVNFYLKEHFCLICTAIKHSKSIKFNSQCSSTHPINCYLMKVPDDEAAHKFRIFLMYGVPSWVEAVSKYCLREVRGRMERRVEPMVLSTDSLSVILERKEGNGWKAEMTRRELLRSKLDFSELSDLDCKEKEKEMNILAYPPYVDILIVHKQTPTEETHFMDTNKVILKSGPNEAIFISIVWEAKVRSTNLGTWCEDIGTLYREAPNGDKEQNTTVHGPSPGPGECSSKDDVIWRDSGSQLPSERDVINALTPDKRDLESSELQTESDADMIPSDAGLQGILEMLPLWTGYVIPLGLSINQLQYYQEQPQESTRGLLALQYWRDGRCGSDYPGTWRFLLDTIKDCLGPKVAMDLKTKVVANKTWIRVSQAGEVSSIGNDAIPAWVDKMADNWFNFGVAIGFSEEHLQFIKDSNDDDVACCSAMMYRWLRTGDPREKTHERLLRAAKEVTPPDPVTPDKMCPEPPPYSEHQKGKGSHYILETMV